MLARPRPWPHATDEIKGSTAGDAYRANAVAWSAVRTPRTYHLEGKSNNVVGHKTVFEETRAL
eukprot:11160445-Lingulodinium_polyedra.AAC.1